MWNNFFMTIVLIDLRLLIVDEYTDAITYQLLKPIAAHLGSTAYTILLALVALHCLRVVICTQLYCTCYMSTSGGCYNYVFSRDIGQLTIEC